MYCSNCGTKVNSNENFCRECGTKVVSLVLESNLEYQGSNFQQNVEQSNINMQQNVEQSNINMQQSILNNNDSNNSFSNFSKDDLLINAYIGKNAEKFKKGGFSVYTFLFGLFYVLYRKMWLLGIIWFLGVLIISAFLPSFSELLTSVIGFVFSFQFNNWYLKHVKEKVEKIKIENSNVSFDQLLNICANKGGTTFIPVIIFGVFYFVIILFNILAVFDTINNVDNITNNNSNTNKDTVIFETRVNNIGDLTFLVPENFEVGKYNSDIYKSYSLNESNDYCRLSISTVNATYYDFAEAYLLDNVYFSSSDEVSEVETKNLNGSNWSFMSVKKTYNYTYYYVAENNDKLYEVEFSITEDSGACSLAYSSFVESLFFN